MHTDLKIRFRMALFLFLLCTVCSSQAWGGTPLRVGEMWTIDGLDPAQEGTFVKEKALIVENLVSADPEFALVPGLAESWKMVSDTHWEFYLRKGVIFHNGEELTAQIAAASINRALKINPALKSISHIVTASAAGALTLKFETDTLFPTLPATMVYADFAIVHPASRTNDRGIITHPVGTGPYRLKQWRRAEQKVLLTRHESYWGQKAAIKEVEIRSIPDPATRSLEIQKGGIDFIADAPYGDLDLLRKKGLKVTLANTARVYQINFASLDNTPFADPRVRLALSHAVNRRDIVRYILFGMGKPAAGPFDSTMAFADKSLVAHKFDPQKAADLLSRAGWIDRDKDGILDKNGKALSITLFTYPQRPGLKPMAMVIAQQWSALGVKTRVRVMDWAAIETAMKPGDARLVATASAMIPDPDYYLRKTFAKDGTDNLWKYANPKVDALLAAGAGQADTAKRLDIYKEVQAIVFKEQPVIIISYYGVNIVTSPKVRGFIFNPVAHDYMLNTQMHLEN